MKNVTLNRWLGTGFENPDCKCDNCGTVGTVYTFNVEGGLVLVKFRLCHNCLNDAITAINNATLFAVS